MLYDNRVVEVYFDHQRIALHLRKTHQNAYTTLDEHMPPHHQRMKEIKGWNKETLLEQAAKVGESTAHAATLMLENSIYIEQTIKPVLGCYSYKENMVPTGLKQPAVVLYWVLVLTIP